MTVAQNSWNQLMRTSWCKFETSWCKLWLFLRNSHNLRGLIRKKRSNSWPSWFQEFCATVITYVDLFARNDQRRRRYTKHRKTDKRKERGNQSKEKPGREGKPKNPNAVWGWIRLSSHRSSGFLFSFLRSRFFCTSRIRIPLSLKAIERPGVPCLRVYTTALILYFFLRFSRVLTSLRGLRGRYMSRFGQ